MTLRTILADDLVNMEPASPENVDLLIRWTMDPIAQGPYKRVPPLSGNELRALLLADPDRSYFVLRRSSDAAPLGRFYWRAWRFRGSSDRGLMPNDRYPVILPTEPCQLFVWPSGDDAT